MTISDAQFAAWTKDQAAKVVVLAELKYGYQKAGLPGEGTIYLADRDYVTAPTDAPASTPYLDVIDSAPDFERSVSLTELGGRGTASVGSLSLSNADGRLDFLLDYILDGRDVAFYLGDMSWSRSDFRLVNVAVVVAVKADSDSQISITLRDKNRLLDATIIGDAIATGPNAGKPKPIIFGQVLNFDLTPYMLSAGDLTYYFNNYPMLDFTRVIDVRDSGVSLAGAPIVGDNTAITADAGTDTISKTAHGLNVDDVVYFNVQPFAGLSPLVQYWVISSGLTANAFKLSASRGGAAVDITGTTFAGTLTIYRRRWFVDPVAATVQLVSAPAGRVTADIRAAGTTGDALLQTVPHAGFRYVLDNWTRLASTDRDSASFDALVAAETAANAQWGRAVLDRTNVMDVLDEIAVCTNSWYGWTGAGKLAVGKLDLFSLAGVATIDSIVEGDIEGDPSCENQPLQFGKIILDANRNVVTQTDGLASSVSAQNRSLWSQPYQVRVKTTDPYDLDYQNDWWGYHKTAIDSAPKETSLFSVGGDAQTLCDDRTNLFRPWTRVFRCTVGIDKYALDPGDPVLVSYPRYGMSAGAKFRVVSVKMRLSARAIDLVLARYSPPSWERSDSYGVPGAPTLLVATKGNGQASVAFTAPAATGGRPITSYTVTSSPGGFSATAASSPITVSGLSNGTAYTFTATATNALGTSPVSAPSNSVTPTASATAPNAPAIGQAVGGNAQALVYFSAPAFDGGSAILDYTATSSPGGFTATGASSPLTVSGLTNGGSYTFTVTARNAVGSSAPSAASNSVVPAAVPGAPTIGTATAGDTTAAVAFSAPASNGGSPILDYTATSSPSGITATGAGSPITVQGLSNGTPYNFTVTARNASGNSPASAASNIVTPGSVPGATVPGAPSIGQASPGNGQANISFSAPSSDGGSPVLDYTATSSPGGFSATAASSPITVPGLTNGTAYTFTVTARNAVGTSGASGASNSVTPATVPGAAAIGSAVAGDRSATVTFSAPASNGGSQITGYTATSSPGGLTASGPGSPLTVQSLVNGTAYTFTVTATNAVGTGAASAASNSVTPAPATATVTAANINQSTVGNSSTHASGSSTAFVSGGVGPFTYSWAFVADGAGITLSGTTTATVLATTTTGGVQIRSGTLRCTVTDTGNGGATSTKDISVYLEVFNNA